MRSKNAVTTFDKIKSSLFHSKQTSIVKLSKKEVEIKKRYEAAFAYWLEHPDEPDRMLVDFLKSTFSIESRQAYTDVARIKELYGNVKNASKEALRYTVIEMLKEAYRKAKDDNQHIAMVMAADKIGRYAKLDQEDIDNLPWDQIMPPNFEPSADPTILNIKNPLNIEERRKKLIKKYLHDDIQDATEV